MLQQVWLWQWTGVLCVINALKRLLSVLLDKQFGSLDLAQVLRVHLVSGSIVAECRIAR